VVHFFGDGGSTPTLAVSAQWLSLQNHASDPLPSSPIATLGRGLTPCFHLSLVLITPCPTSRQRRASWLATRFCRGMGHTVTIPRLSKAMARTETSQRLLTNMSSYDSLLSSGHRYSVAQFLGQPDQLGGRHGLAAKGDAPIHLHPSHLTQ